MTGAEVALPARPAFGFSAVCGAGASKRAGWGRGLGLFVCGLLILTIVLSAGSVGAELAESLETVPFPELSAAEASVREQLGEARAELEALADRSPAVLAKAYGSLGELYHGYDLTEAAMACYRNAHRLAPREARWLHLLGVLQRMQGDLEPAASSFAAVLDLAEQDPSTILPAMLHLAAIRLDLGDLDTGESLSRSALEIEPRSAAAYSTLGRIATSRGDHAAAVTSFEKALELAPSATRLHYLAGQAYRRLGELDKARAHLQRQGPGEPAFADPRLASVFTSLVGSAALMQRAAKAEVAGQLEASVEIYRQAVAAAPQSPEARRDLGALLSRIGRHEEAAEQYREAVRLEPERGLNHFVLALMLEAMGDGAGGIESMARAVAAEPDYREFRLALAGRLAGTGRLEEALGHFEHVLERHPDSSRARLERAKVNLQLQNFAGADADARAVLAADVADRQRAEALAVQGVLAARRGERERAVDLLEQALLVDDNLAEAHFELANIAGISGDFQQAAARYRRVSEIDPARVAAWLGEATALALDGREADAVARLEVGRQARPDAGVLSFALARLLLSATDSQVRSPGRAVELVERLLASSRSPEHGDFLVQAYAAAGRLTEAIQLQQQMIEAMPPGFDPLLLAAWSERLQALKRQAGQ